MASSGRFEFFYSGTNCTVWGAVPPVVFACNRLVHAHVRKSHNSFLFDIFKGVRTWKKARACAP